MAQNFEARNSCQPGAALHLLVRPSFRFFPFHFLSHNSPISRFCPSDDAPYGEWAFLKFATFFAFFYHFSDETKWKSSCIGDFTQIHTRELAPAYGKFQQLSSDVRHASIRCDIANKAQSPYFPKGGSSLN